MRATEQERKKQYFPKIMESKDKNGNIIVLFHEERKGTVLIEEAHLSSWFTGSYAEDWEMDNFTDYTGEITLSND